jgi:hypothetical protein
MRMRRGSSKRPTGAGTVLLAGNLPTRQKLSWRRGLQCASTGGRDSVLDELAAHLDSAEQGQRRVVFVTGEPGAGKTTLIEAFLAAQANTGLLIVRGQCLEQYGEAEPFLPVLEAFGQLSVPAWRSKFIEVLRTHAPRGWCRCRL